MNKIVLDNKIVFIVIHLVFGFLGTLPLFPSILGLLSVAIPVYLLYTKGNKDELAIIFAAYITGAEVFIRMTGGFVLYETGKYAVILFLLMGIFGSQFKQPFSYQFLLYIFLLLIGIIFTEVPAGESIRKNILFNLSGPFLLGISAIYFHQRSIKLKMLLDALFFMLLPLLSMIMYLYLRTPDLKEIVFHTAANFATSGGFGPNQVATAIGLGMFIITVFILTKYKLTGFVILDSMFLIYFSYRGLLTFSRGGILASFITLIVFSFFYILHKRISIGILLKYLLTAIFFVISIWLYTSNITGGMLNNRYSGKNAIGEKKDITTGRLDIIEIQLENFLSNPLGIGVGSGKYKRLEQIEHVTGASHNEIGRILEEHGYIGLLILIMLLTIPMFNFFRGNLLQKAFIISFYSIWFLTINHSAMRIALPGFIYGLSLIRIEDIYD